MATSYTRRASRKLSPAYRQQVTALKSQLPAIDQLYQALGTQQQGVEQQQTQQAFEDSSGRGLLHSTIPVDLQTGIQQQGLQKRAELAGQQAKEVGQVNQNIAGIRVDRASAIANLANALRQSGLQSKQFRFTKRQALRELRQKRRLQQREFALQRELAGLGIF